jgi:carboxyl-terminal processing protease
MKVLGKITQGIIRASLAMTLMGISLFGELSAEEVLSCEDFEKILSFVESEHLRFALMSERDVVALRKAAALKVPSLMKEDSFLMSALDFEKSGVQKKLIDKISSRAHLCENLVASRYREYFLKSFVSELDPFSDFYLTRELSTRSSVLDGEFVGVGIGSKFERDYIEVTEVVKTGPSEGLLQKGDRILKIDGRPIRGLTHKDIRSRIRGDRLTTVEFQVQRGEEVLDLQIIRDRVSQVSLTHRLADDGILHMKVHRFYAHTAMEVRELLMQHRDKTKGIILDLRDNPGGLLQSARDLVGLFIRAGLVVHIRGVEMKDELWTQQHMGDWTSPMVVLINEKTASASEIVAGALQDHGRAVLVGQPTYGKSSIQNIYDTQSLLQTDYAGQLKVTSLWYYLPSGRSVDLIEPDLKIAAVETEEKRFRELMPFRWPQKIEVQFAARINHSFNMEGDFSAEELKAPEQLGEVLIRKWMAFSSDLP